jgi:UDP-N-acetylmuramate--alanine ligase
MPLLNGAKKVHIIGAGGIGLSAAAKLLLRRGYSISGSDLEANEATEELAALGMTLAIGHRAENLPNDAEAIVYSDAIPESNPERVAAAQKERPQFSYYDLLGQLTAEYRTVAVSGTNGKSSTTAMLGLALIEAGLDPTVIVGSKVETFPDQNLRSGESDWLVVEACEYRANMLKLAPQVVTLTNLEPDHLDFYKDFDHIKQTFQQYLDQLAPDSLVVMNADDPDLAKLKVPGRLVSYSIDQPANYRAQAIETGAGWQLFRLTGPDGEDLGPFVLGVPGRYNVSNALAAIATALELGADLESVRAAIAGFHGIWRRFQKMGHSSQGAQVISDYGHTPTAVRETLLAAQQFYPDARLVLCFQPHHRHRTRQLFDQFVESFDEADLLVLPEIYDVSGREEEADAAVSSQQLMEAVRRRDATAGRDRRVDFVPDPDAAEAWLRAELKSHDVVLVMGAGNIYKIAERLVGN